MPNPVIDIQNLSKSYVIRHQQDANYGSIRETIVEQTKSVANQILRGHNKQTHAHREEFWALNDVSFSIDPGERVGIIGRNGAGKSTLLKVLSRITEPTKGKLHIRGRVASLLEVGTGFHPELTGRENIYLNGAILGMSRSEIKYKFDEIVDFAEIEKFLDTPVKRYSSGMYVRLAFAVAAHLEPEILIVDEVLAVGDAQFQKKCLGKMDDVSRTGRTIIFVSHQMDVVRQLCNRCILLHQGTIQMDTDPQKAIDAYMSNANLVNSSSFSCEPDLTVPIQITNVYLSRNLKKTSVFDIYDDITLHVQYNVNQPITGAIVGFAIKRTGTTIFQSFDADTNPELLQTRQIGEYTRQIELPCPLLKTGEYTVDFITAVLHRSCLQLIEDALSFSVKSMSHALTFQSYAEKRAGILVIPLEWHSSN